MLKGNYLSEIWYAFSNTFDEPHRKFNKILLQSLFALSNYRFSLYDEYLGILVY